MLAQKTNRGIQAIDDFAQTGEKWTMKQTIEHIIADVLKMAETDITDVNLTIDVLKCPEQNLTLQ